MSTEELDLPDNLRESIANVIRGRHSRIVDAAVLAERSACRDVARAIQIEHVGEASRAVGSAAHGLAGCKAAVAERIADAIGARK